MSFNFPNAEFGADSTVQGYKIPLSSKVVVALSASSASQHAFIADEALELVGVREVHGTASTSGTLQVEKLTGTQAAGAGTSMLTGTVSLSGTANTVVSGTLVSSIATKRLAAGDRVGLVIAGTMTNLANCVVELIFKRV
jgi:hypothetical protein